MAHERYTRTNQKLYFAGLALDNWRQAEKQGGVNSSGLIQAEREASLFHLYGALLGLCHEITGYYRLPGANAPRVELLLMHSPEDAPACPELAELMELVGQPGSWVADLLAAYAALFEPPREPVKPKTDPRMQLIEAVGVGDEVPPLSLADVQGWREQLKILALRYREALSEW
ncbi:MAG: PasA protein [Pseudomonas stutzeri]|nr:PasA protein [Stutzerimonas stutzeri]